MAVYLITYDLNAETVRPNIVQAIRKLFPEGVKLSDSSYAVATRAGNLDIVTALSKHLGDNDSLYVIKLSEPVGGRGPQEVNDWLELHLPE